MWSIITFLVNLCPFAPEQVHVSFTENENELRVQWVTWHFLSSTLFYRPISCESLNSPSESDWQLSAPEVRKYHPGSWGLWHYYLNIASLSNLRRECNYEYYVENGRYKSEVYWVKGRTPEIEEPFEDNKNPVHAWVFGDWGIGWNGENTRKLLNKLSEEEDFDAIFHLGDIAYNMHTLQGMVGDHFLKEIENIATKIPYMVAVGNHDNHGNKTHYKNRFSMPRNQENQGTNLFYSVNLGPAHFIILNTVNFGSEEHADEITTQLNWLKKDLALAQERRKDFPWIFVLSHYAFYCTTDWTYSNPYGTFGECLKESDKLKNNLEDLLLEYQVDVVFQGHVHNYERDGPIYKNISVSSPEDTFNMHVNPSAPVYILTGCAGNPTGQNDPISSTYAEWTRYLSELYGVGELFIYNDTHIYFQQYRADTQEIIDYVHVIKEAYD